jgi:hypothetical protein
VQLNGVVQDTGRPRSDLRDLNTAIATLKAHEKSLGLAVDNLATAGRYVANATGGGPWVNLYAQGWLASGQRGLRKGHPVLTTATESSARLDHPGPARRDHHCVRSVRRRPRTVSAYFDDTAGLFVGNEVGVLGVPVGQVTDDRGRG